MGKAQLIDRAYKVYKFINHGKVYDRVKGPNGLDIGIFCPCAGCYALYMNIAYEEGKLCARKKKAATR